MSVQFGLTRELIRLAVDSDSGSLGERVRHVIRVGCFWIDGGWVRGGWGG